MSEVLEIGKRAKAAAAGLAAASSARKSEALERIAAALIERADQILIANTDDVTRAQEEGVTGALIDRLMLTPGRIEAMAQALRDLIGLKDPVGEVLEGWTLPNGVHIDKVRVPLGVVGIIYEARPNVTVDAAGLCLKSGNACILRGSRSAISSNIVLARIIDEAASSAGLPPGSVQLIPSTDRESAKELMRMRDFVDVLIPRGGADLIRAVVEESTVPVIETGVGNCHIYVDESADFDKAVGIIVNAKTQRPGVCNAAESMLVHRAVAAEFLPRALAELHARGVEIRGDETVRGIDSAAVAATEDDWRAEFLDLILAVKVVDSLDEAIAHVNRYGTHHSDAIVTQDYSAARTFTLRVDSACVMVNASTRFSDGGEFGFGAEIGISNQKLHARGPMALPELTSYKYVVTGEGQVRA
ncbi:MAG: glutamate-5-semialdehyde dehydrogenase [Actinomycetota bacterium]